MQLASKSRDKNITHAKGTGFMDSLDPLFATIADKWTQAIIEDFGTDHWYQMDGYFNGAVAPWMSSELTSGSNAGLIDDAMAYKRGLQAYRGLNRTDPEAIWSFQGWQFVGWTTEAQAAFIKGFVDAAPAGKMVFIDMSMFGTGQWHQFKNASFFGAPFMLTAIQDFGGDDGMKGNIAAVNDNLLSAQAQGASVFGTGGTMEGPTFSLCS